MQTFRVGLVATAALAALAVLPLPHSLAATAAPPDQQVTEKDFNVENFSDASITVDNQFLPLTPGTQFTLVGTATRGTAGTHEVVFTVTDVTKVVNGVRAVVLWDRDFQDGALVEEELAFMAQDDAGNVWSLGEYPEEHENGKVSAPSTWLAGGQRAAAGVLMRVNPKTNTTAYLQGQAPAIGFLDKAKVSAVNQQVCVPTGCYTGVLVVDEWAPLDQPEDGHQFKYHAPGVGVVQVAGKGGVEQETLVLNKLVTLTCSEMAAATTRALELDTRAYTLAKTVYRTSPVAAVRDPATPCVEAAPPAAPAT